MTSPQDIKVICEKYGLVGTNSLRGAGGYPRVKILGKKGELGERKRVGKVGATQFGFP